MSYELFNDKNFNAPNTILEWYLKRDSLDFNPRYQREGLVWNLKNKQLLIDSIINDFDIPKFYFHLNTIKDNPIVNIHKKDHLFSIIDGKQRLSSIFEFIENKWPLPNDFIFFKNPSIDLSGLYYKDIAIRYPNIRVKFDNYYIDSIFIQTSDIKMVHLLFLRLNSGISIKNPEIRKAMYGFITEQIENEVITNEFFQRKIKLKNKFSDYFNIFSKLLIIEYADLTNNTVNLSKSAIDNFFEKNSDENRSLLTAFNKVKVNLSVMCDVFQDKDDLLNKVGSIILYYLLIKKINNKISNLMVIREFLLEFELMRKDNKMLIKDNSADNRLLEFDRLNQQGSTNIKSFIERIQLLELFFEDYLVNKGK